MTHRLLTFCSYDISLYPQVNVIINASCALKPMRSVDLICLLSLPKDLAPATVDACTMLMYITHSHGFHVFRNSTYCSSCSFVSRL